MVCSLPWNFNPPGGDAPEVVKETSNRKQSAFIAGGIGSKIVKKCRTYRCILLTKGFSVVFTQQNKKNEETFRAGNMRPSSCSKDVVVGVAFR